TLTQRSRVSTGNCATHRRGRATARDCRAPTAFLPLGYLGLVAAATRYPWSVPVTSVLSRPSRDGERVATRRHYLMCPPAHFAVTYAINPWMRPGVAVDVERALAQWDALRRTYLDLGHRVDLLDPVA